MSDQLFRVEHSRGVDLLKTDGTFDFDGGSLLVWRDRSRTHLLAAYSPSTEWIATWGDGDDGAICPEQFGAGSPAAQ